MGGEFQPGEFLPSQKELAIQFEVGLSTVREAIQILSAEGLLHSLAGKGTWIASDAFDTIVPLAAIQSRLGDLNSVSLFEARSVIELALTEFAAERATQEDLAEMWRALEAMKVSIQDEDAFVRADLDFHLAVARAGRNSFLQQLYQLSRKLLSETITQLVRLPRVKENSIMLQSAIARAIEQRDPKQARLAAQKHMTYNLNLVRICDSDQSVHPAVKV